MAKNIGILVCLLLVILDVAAGILGIQAEVEQNKVQDLKVWIFECRDPSYEAFKLGLAATVLLVLAQVISNLLAGCICIQSKEELDKASSNKQLAFASFVFQWIIMGIAFSLLVAGTLSNGKARKSCGISHHRFFSIGGILCFIHGLFSVSYYISATATIQEDNKLNQHGGHA
ncbi:protein DESIGUAL 2 [Lycium barbarum]|uniref:protein DESIGUAL 2 n=1 Tax=Lycium barbarum TaxID=112863 RepID=UPI00293ED9B2|nr:protein DESIGUAL 2 [Lycium barbarum]